ncbi:MAG: radical SAM/SPASM domain-containing protein [Candidatus Delongbacteria bacterium]
MTNDIYYDSIAMDVTNRCNLRCLHCFNSSGDHNFEKKELTLNELKTISKQIITLKPSTVCLCGGEPLIRGVEIFEIVTILKSGGIENVNMVSNGYLIDEKMARKIRESGVKFIQISVDGQTSAAHDWLRNKQGSHEHAINAIKYLVAEGLYVGVACTPTKKNINEIPELIDMLYSMGVKMFRMQPIMGLGRAKDIKEYYPTSTDYFKVSRYIERCKKSEKYPNLSFEWGDPLDHIFLLRGGVGARGLTINAYGDILISPYIPISFGNLKRHTIQEYIDAGLFDLPKLELVTTLCSKINNEEELDINSINPIFPELYKSELMSMDLIDDNIEEKSKPIISSLRS